MALTTYKYPVSGTTPPTAAQMNQPGGAFNALTAVIQMLDADTTLTVVHNMGLSAAEQANQFPFIDVTVQAVQSAATAFPNLLVVPTPGNVANSLTFTKGGTGATGQGTGFTALVQLLRPHTLIQ